MEGDVGGVLLEREDEIARLVGLSRDAACGRGSVVAIRGPAGVGKTALLDSARAAGERAGLRVLSASGAELERELGFGVVRQLFERPLRALPDAERAEVLQDAPGLASAVVLDAEPAAPRPEAVHAAMHGLYWLVAELAERRPLLLAVDDAHWADAPSLRWLAYLARRLQGVPLVMITASRDAEPGADSALLEQVLSEATAGVVRPSPLSRCGVERWLERSYDGPPAPEFVESCWSATHGNPLLLGELTAELRAEGLAADARAAARVDGVAPGTIARSVLTRLARLGSDAVGIAEAVAVLSQDARLDRVATLSRVDLPRAAEIVDLLVASGVLADREPIAFAHPVLRAAVYEQIPSTRRGLAHAAAARRLMEDGGGTERAASHLLLAPAVSDQVAVDVLRVAASAAIGRAAPDAAVPLLRRALTEPPAQRAEVLLELAMAEATARDPAAVEHAQEAMATAPSAELRARAALLTGRSLIPLGRFDEARESLATADAESQSLDPEARLEIQMQALVVAAWTSGRVGLGERLSALGVDDLPGDSTTERVLLGLRVMDEFGAGDTFAHRIDLARRALAREDLTRSADERIVLTLGHALAIADYLDEARDASSALIEGGRIRGSVVAATFGYTTRADVEFRAGRLAETEADANQALTLALEYGLDLIVPGALTHLVDALVERAAPSAALELITSHGLVGEAVPAHYGGHLFLHARGRARAAAGDSAGAVADFRACGSAQTAWGDRNPATIPWRSSLALALHALGSSDEPQQLAEEELWLARHFGAARAIGIALRACGLVSHVDGAIEALMGAVGTLADSPARLEHARALVDLGAAQRRAGHRRQARETLAAGLDAAHRCGAHQLSERARAELTAAGARPRRERLSGPESLTASERRVAQLAAEGLTNRQIAQALFVTTKTVEMHLGRVYPKLGIAGRAELAGVLGEGQQRVAGAVASACSSLPASLIAAIGAR
jgi:DNA-binding CsgD family transcriptional regulator